MPASSVARRSIAFRGAGPGAGGRNNEAACASTITTIPAMIILDMIILDMATPTLTAMRTRRRTSGAFS